MYKRRFLTLAAIAGLVTVMALALTVFSGPTPAYAQVYLTPVVSSTSLDPLVNGITANTTILIPAAIGVVGLLAAFGLLMKFVGSLRRLKTPRI